MDRVRPAVPPAVAVTPSPDRLVPHHRLDGGRLVVVHAGLPERWQGRESRRVRDFCLYGQRTDGSPGSGGPGPQGHPPWAAEYQGAATVL